MRSIQLACFYLAICMVGGTCYAAGTGQISGTVQDDKGKPVPQAKVSVLVRPPARPTVPIEFFNTDVTADDSGKFSVTAVPAGRYAVCASAPGLLSPCIWEVEPLVNVTNGQAVAVGIVQLKHGADFYVRVNDLSGNKASTEGKVAGASLMLGVRAPNGAFIRVPQTAADAHGADHHLVVPAGVALTFTAYSQMFDLTDSNNTAINKQNGLAQAIQIPTAQAQHMEVINVK